MSQSLSKILVHTVFSTRNRAPFLRDPGLRNEMHRYLGGILTRLECQPIIVGGTEDHVHLLNSLSRTCDPAKMVKELKRGSAVWVNGGFDLNGRAHGNKLSGFKEPRKAEMFVR